MMLEQKTTDFLGQLSSSAPFPGGGGASAAVGAFATALGLMVANLTVGKKRYAEVEGEILSIKNHLELLQKELVELVDKDAEAFAPLSKAYALPKNTEEEKKEREHVMEEGLYGASIVPLQIMEKIYEAMMDFEFLGENGSKMAISDVGVGVLFARAALESASLNVFINTKSMKNRERAEELNRRADGMIQKSKDLEEKIYTDVLEKIR